MEYSHGIPFRMYLLYTKWETKYNYLLENIIVYYSGVELQPTRVKVLSNMSDGRPIVLLHVVHVGEIKISRKLCF